MKLSIHLYNTAAKFYGDLRRIYTRELNGNMIMNDG